MIEGATSLDEISRTLGTHLDAEGADRLAGWVAYHAGRLLKAGETVEAQGFRATVRRLRNHRIDQIQLERLPAASPPDARPGAEGMSA